MGSAIWHTSQFGSQMKPREGSTPVARRSRRGLEGRVRLSSPEMEGLRHVPGRHFVPAREVRDGAGNAYRLAAEFDHGAISGFYWALYRNERSSTSVPNP